ncbi:MAG TPA: 2-hydroxyacid dehydrogenase [Streptosporangiaceae bacterium]|nr:2-hydroxyacid dehydrogenase [Streptosporangiaceae bacterium]
MPHERIVAVTYQANEEYIKINTDVLGADATLVYSHQAAEDERVALVARAQALITWNPARELPPGTLASLPELAFIQLLSAGADGVDFTAIPENVALAGNVGAYATPIAEHVVAMSLALARRLPQRHAGLAAGDFNQRDRLITLNGAVCAILGYGGIGAATAALMRGLGARIYAVNSTGRTADPVDFAGTLADLDEVLSAADVLVIALPLTNKTRDLIGARELSLMKPTAIMVNVARGAIINEQALYEHLKLNPQFMAGIDAWWHEPGRSGSFRTDYPFFDLPNVLGSPHNSGIVPGVLTGAIRKAAENVRRHLRGEPVTGVMRSEDYL